MNSSFTLQKTTDISGALKCRTSYLELLSVTSLFLSVELSYTQPDSEIISKALNETLP